MKVLVCDKMDEKALGQLTAIEGLEVTNKPGMTPEQLAKTVQDFQIMIVRSATKVTKEIIDAAPNLKVVIRGGVGIDNIDVAYAKTKGIEVRNTPKASSASVAELALSMMFAVARNITKADRSMKEGKWEKKLFKGFELNGKTLCIIGCGNIGTELGQRARALGMDVIYTDYKFRGNEELVSRMIRLANRVAPNDEMTLTNFDQAIAKADIISLHVPFSKELGPLLDQKEFETMKKGVIIINAARGGVVKESALLEALASEKVAAAAIDVYEKEPTDNSKLIERPNVICTPHIGASTYEAQARVGSEVVDIVKEYFDKAK